MLRAADRAAGTPDPHAARFRALVEHSTVVVTLFDPEGRLIYTNPAVERVLGWRPEEVVGEMGIEFVHPDDAAEANRLLGVSALQSGLLLPFRHRLRHRDGTWRTVEGAAIGMMDDPAVGAIVSSFSDVTDRVRIERALREGEERYRTLFANAPVGIGLAAPDGTLLEFNEAMMRPGGYTRDDIHAIGNVARLYADPEARTAVLARLRQDGRVLHQEVQFLRKDGSPYDAMLSLTPVMIDGEPRVLAIVEDISERRALVRRLVQSQKMEAVGQLAGGVAHDFNNLLTAIRGYADLCAVALPPDHPAQDFVSQILEASDRATEVTRRLLAFARRERVEPRLVDVHEVVSELEKLLRRLIGERVVLQLDRSDAPAVVRIDPSLFEQVIVNLAVNARDAMPDGGILRIITAPASAAAVAAAGAAPGEWIAVEVGDTGIGMSPEVRARAFEPFFTTKSPDRGTGLGLSTCYGLIRQAGGYIDLDSAPGRGTRVRILLPLQRADRGAAPHGDGVVPDRHARVERGGGETILLVEDESGVRQFARIALERLGYRVIEARDGAEALGMARGHDGPIHLVLSDVVMPHLTGPQLAAMMREERPRARIVFMSGYADPSAQGSGVDLDGAELLIKPFSVDTLARRLRTVLDAS